MATSATCKILFLWCANILILWVWAMGAKLVDFWCHFWGMMPWHGGGHFHVTVCKCLINWLSKKYLMLWRHIFRILTGKWNFVPNCLVWSKLVVCSSSPLHLNKCNLNLALIVLMMTWPCTCTSWRWSQWPSSGLCFSALKICKMRLCLQNALTRHLVGSVGACSHSIIQATGLKALGLSNVVVPLDTKMCPSIPTVDTRGLRPWCWGMLAILQPTRSAITVANLGTSRRIAGS